MIRSRWCRYDSSTWASSCWRPGSISASGEAGSRQYVSFIKDRGGKKLAEGFRELLGCAEGVDSSGETRTLSTPMKVVRFGGLIALALTTEPRQGPWPDPRSGQHPHATTLNRGPPDARPLGGRYDHGYNNRSAVGTLVERTTRLVILAKLDGTTATAAAIGFSDKLNEVPRALRLSMTYKLGKRDGKARRDHPENRDGDLLCR